MPPGRRCETSVRGGACKLQWKADWAMRWFALGVDYEMSGKDDLLDSVRLSGRICNPGQPIRRQATYELFLDEHAQKSASRRATALSVEEWLRYAPAEITWAVHVQTRRRGRHYVSTCMPRAADDILDQRTH